MTKLFTKISAGITSASLVATLLAPAVFADVTSEISGNGENSTNKVIVNAGSSVVVLQGNETMVETEAKSEAKTGGNEASGNTGGDVTIDTGNASATTAVVVTGAANDALVPGPCCLGNIDSTIKNNGDGSFNKVKVTEDASVGLGQGNLSSIGTEAKSKAKTGKNNANGNTGGSVDIDTGNATAGTTVVIGGASNTADLPSPCCDEDVNSTISGNGLGSYNKVKVTKNKSVLAGQINATGVGTLAKAKAKTGKNNANGNTGGATTVNTGNATSSTGVSVSGPSNTLNP